MKTHCVSSFHVGAVFKPWMHCTIWTDSSEGNLEIFGFPQNLHLNLGPQLLKIRHTRHIRFLTPGIQHLLFELNLIICPK